MSYCLETSEKPSALAHRRNVKLYTVRIILDIILEWGTSLLCHIYIAPTELSYFSNASKFIWRKKYFTNQEQIGNVIAELFNSEPRKLILGPLTSNLKQSCKINYLYLSGCFLLIFILSTHYKLNA